MLNSCCFTVWGFNSVLRIFCGHGGSTVQRASAKSPERTFSTAPPRRSGLSFRKFVESYTICQTRWHLWHLKITPQDQQFEAKPQHGSFRSRWHHCFSATSGEFSDPNNTIEKFLSNICSQEKSATEKLDAGDCQSHNCTTNADAKQEVENRKYHRRFKVKALFQHQHAMSSS